MACSDAILDFDLPIFLFLNKNCLFKFDISIKSLSVIIVFLSFSVDIPIMKNFLIIHIL